MTGARVFVAHACQLGFGVADCFMSANDSIDGRFAFGLEPGYTATRVLKVARQLLRFDFSFGVLTGSAIAFAGQTVSLLRQAFESAFELPRNLPDALGDRRLREQFGARVFDLDFGGRRAGEFLRVRLFSRAQFGSATVRFFTEPGIFLL